MTTGSTTVADARADAIAAAERAGTTVRELTAADIRSVRAVIAQVWGPQQAPQSNLLQALAHAGNPVLMALRGGTPVGAAFGFLGWNDGVHLHSHMAGVVAGSESLGIGWALKLAQRAVCLREGITEMRWTFDPLVARNAYFNLVKIGGRVRAFHPDLYGDMDDVVNSGDQSDRFEVTWRLDAPLSRGTSAGFDDGRSVRVPVPADYLALRGTDPAAAREARRVSSQQFTRLFSDGLTPSWAGDGYCFTTGGTSLD
jgi:predicted GNAT superfamily acetyltransferase